MYFPPMGYDEKGNRWGYDRFDDIWAGIFAKKIIDHLGYAVVNGSPFVEHKKASNVNENFKKEANGIKTNETLYKKVKNVELTSNNIKKSHIELIDKIKLPNESYFRKLKKSIKIWAELLK